MASESFEADSEAKLPTVQVGDPFTEKILLEACLQALKTGAIVALQDMGAAGLTSSTFEMCSRGHAGMVLDLDRVPLREPDLQPWEIMLSESQERMVLVAQRGREEELARIFDRWGLAVEPIGEVTATGRALLKSGGRVVADVPIKPLTDGAPVYRRPATKPKALAKRQEEPEVPPVDDAADVLRRLLDTPDLGSKEWIWRQYDHTVRTNTVRGPGGDAAVVVVKGTPLGLALATDVNPVYCWLDPRRGGMHAVVESVRNLACAGAEPLGITDCLNFGNPENPEIAWQFRESVRGIAQACRALEVPVISGNVSFYNETRGQSIHPTPSVAVAGILPDLENVPVSWFAREQDRVILLGEDRGEMGGSEYLRLLHGIEQGRPPEIDLEAEARLADLLRFLAFDGILRTAHDVSSGGLGVALAEACFGAGLGVRLELPLSPTNLFSETQARAVITVSRENVDDVLEEAREMGVAARDVGEVGGRRLVLALDGGKLVAEVEDLHQVWRTALPRALEGG
jgi:phosphoribosylformylglycinamidine synthase